MKTASRTRTTRTPTTISDNDMRDLSVHSRRDVPDTSTSILCRVRRLQGCAPPDPISGRDGDLLGTSPRYFDAESATPHDDRSSPSDQSATRDPLGGHGSQRRP